MNKSRFVAYSTAIATALVLSACNKQPNDTIKTEPSAGSTNSDENRESALQSPQTHYEKPSAPIQIHTDYDGVSKVGDVESFNVILTAAQAGTLAIEIQATDNVIQGEQNGIYNAIPDEAISIPISLTPQVAKPYYVTVQARLTLNGKQQSKVYRIAIQPEGTLKTQTKSQQGRSAGGVVVYDAEETILTNDNRKE